MTQPQTETPAIIVALPCYNEAVTIAKVVQDFKQALPEAAIHVFDNNSTDDSAELARQAGAEVHFVGRQGKGHVMRAIFNKLQADVILVADGDDTYFAEDARKMMAPVLAGKADMVVGNRLNHVSDESMMRLHQFGNSLLVWIINRMFGSDHQDILSGYRAFSPDFISGIPILTTGFEIETEITLQALEEGLSVVEVPISYRSRPDGSESKLRTFQDGYRILLTAAVLLRDHRPLRLFGLIGIGLVLIALVAGFLRLGNYVGITTLPNSLLSGILLLCAPLGLISFSIGLTLNTINTRFREMKQIIQRKK